MPPPASRPVAGLAILLALTACRAAARSTTAVTTAPFARASTTSTVRTTVATPTPTTTTTTTTARAAFSGTIAPLTAAALPFTYHPGCPVGPAALRLLHLSYWGFDDRPHLGTMVVNTSVARSVVTVFARLFGAHFPIREMQPVDAFAGSDPASMAADNTSGFNCRDAVAPGAPRWSVHAYGEAIDVNPVENPYLEGGRVRPAAGAAFVDRGRVRAGMAAPGTVLNSAFAAAGWLWGGRWSGAADYQHFSQTGG